jgi:hypothetical protein
MVNVNFKALAIIVAGRAQKERMLQIQEGQPGSGEYHL